METELPPIPRPLDQGWTLPATWYSDLRVFELERERIFATTWQYAGWTAQVERPGSYFTSIAGHIPCVVTRDREGELHAFVNVCRHRGHVVAQGSGYRETLQCPYHAWTYGLDGSLRRAPRSEREPAFDPSDFSLLPVAVDTWGPFVFVNPDASADPLPETLAEVSRLIEDSSLDLNALRFHSHHEWEQPVNWKVALENYLECYHCPVAHPGFSKLIDVDPDNYRLLPGVHSSSQLGPVRDSVVDGPYDARGGLTESQYHFIWPNTTINIAPGPQNLSIERWVPAGPRTTIEVTDYFFAADVPEDRIQEVIAFDSQVAGEDVALVQSVQRGLDSNTVLQGRLMPESEQLIVDFQRRVFDALTNGV